MARYQLNPESGEVYVDGVGIGTFEGNTPTMFAALVAANAAESARVESERLRERIRIADHIITRIGRRPAANGDYRGYAWAQAEAELSVLIDQYNALAGAALHGREVACARDSDGLSR